jgi:hypothetical protein
VTTCSVILYCSYFVCYCQLQWIDKNMIVVTLYGIMCKIGARGNIVGRGTILQGGRSRFWFPIRSLDFSIREILGSDLGQDMCYPDRFVAIFSVPKSKFWDSILTRPRPLPSKSFPLYLHTYHRHSSVGTKPGWGLDGGGSVPSRDTILLFSTASRQALGRTQPPILWVQGLFPWR